MCKIYVSQEYIAAVVFHAIRACIYIGKFINCKTGVKYEKQFNTVYLRTKILNNDIFCFYRINFKSKKHSLFSQ